MDLRIYSHVSERLGRGPCDFLRGEARGHLVLRETREGFVEHGGDGCCAVAAGLSVLKAGIGIDARQIEGASHARQVSLARASDDAYPGVVLRPEEVGERVVRLGARPRGGNAAEEELDREVGVERVEAGAEQAHIDKLPLACLQRLDEGRVYGGDGGDAGGVVARGGADGEEFGALWRSEARKAGAGPEAGDVETGGVGVGTFEAVAGERAVDELRVALRENVVAQPGALDAAGADICKEDVSRIGELADDLAALFGAGVDDDGLLAAVVAVKGGVVGQVGKRRALGREIGADGVAPRRFDLDNFCAPVRQNAASPWSSEICRVFNDFYAFEEQSGLPKLCAASRVFGPAVNMC